MAQGFDPNGAGQFPVQSVQLSQNLQSRQQEAQRQYAMRIQAQQQQLTASNMAARQAHQAGQMPGMPGQHPGMQQHVMQGQMQNTQANPQAFIKNVQALMAQQRRPFNPTPVVAGKTVNLANLYQLVLRLKGFRNVTMKNAWPSVAQHLGIPPQQYPTAPDELRHVYEQNLAWYEAAYVQKQQQQQQMKNINSMPAQMGQMGQIGGQMGGQMAQMNQMNQMGQMGQMGQQMSPSRAMPSGGPSAAAAQQQEYLQQLQRKAAMQQQHQQQQQQHQQHQQQQHQQQQQQQQQRQSDVGLQQQQLEPSMQQQQQQQPQVPPQSTPLQNSVAPALVNGRSTPQTDANIANQHRKSMSRPLEGTPGPMPDTTQANTTPLKAEESAPVSKSAAKPSFHIEEKADGIYYKPVTTFIKDSWGLLEMTGDLTNAVDDKLRSMPIVPDLRDMGVVDIRAFTMGIRSGLVSEVTNALDYFVKLTYEHSIQLELDQCEDLVDALVECAEDQLEVLANDNPEVTDIIELMSYEDVIQNCTVEVNSLQDIPRAGTRAKGLDGTAARLLAITSILRNLSFLEINHAVLSQPAVLKFIASAIRLVGTRMLLLRSHLNTFDFMKDLITFFSNTSTKIELPSREDAYAVLHFLCAFAPSPRPGLPVRFTPYHPRIHRYLPSAVDSLAKLLARDDPNRTFYKQIVANEATSDPPYDLLTRAFALAIAVVPDRTEGRLHDVAETRPKDVRHFEARIAEARKPYLMQGMLAADILATLAPGPETGVCQSWLEADDGWACSLLKFAMSLCSTDATMPHPPPPQPHQRQRPMAEDREGFQLIVHRALSMLKRLGDKSKGGEPLVKSVQTNGVNHEDDENDENDSDDDMDDFVFGGSTWRVRADILPRKETVLGALLMSTLDSRSLRQFAGLGYLAES